MAPFANFAALLCALCSKKGLTCPESFKELEPQRTRRVNSDPLMRTPWKI
jgi:hypothetical protein